MGFFDTLNTYKPNILDTLVPQNDVANNKPYVNPDSLVPVHANAPRPVPRNTDITSIDYGLITNVQNLLERMRFGANVDQNVFDLVQNDMLFRRIANMAEAKTFQARSSEYDYLKSIGLTDDDLYNLVRFQQEYGYNYLKTTPTGYSFFQDYLDNPKPDEFMKSYYENVQSQLPQQTPTETEPGATTGLVNEILQGPENINKLYDLAYENVDRQMANWWDQMSKEAERRLIGRNLPLGGIANKNFAALAKQGSEALGQRSTAIESERARALQGLPYEQLKTLEPIRQFEANYALQSQLPYLNLAYQLQNIPWGTTSTTSGTIPGTDPLLGFLQGMTYGQQLGNILGGAGNITPTATMPSATALPSPMFSYSGLPQYTPTPSLTLTQPYLGG